ncbi:nucleic-acid-binding protein from transposon X-element [Trichonephila clavipes]|nr:nucleic-acid-binding protein from transposon X-element [Trichonephila clavipes]
MPGKRVRRHFSQLSEFERGLIIGMKTAGWSTSRVAGQVDRSESAVKMFGSSGHEKAVDGSAELSCFVPTDELSWFLLLSCFVPAAGGRWQCKVELFCSCLRVELFSPVEAPLLRIVRTKGKDGETISQYYDRPQYLPLVRHSFQTIQSELTSEPRIHNDEQSCRTTRIFRRYLRKNRLIRPSLAWTRSTPRHRSRKCESMKRLGDEIQFISDRLSFLDLTPARMRIGKSKKTQEDFDRIILDIEGQKKILEHQTGLLLSIGSCPLPDCHFHRNLNAIQIVKKNEEEALKLQLLLANNISNVKTNLNAKTDEPKNKKLIRTEGFTSPTKVAKKQKILENYSVGVDAVNVQNKFKALAGSSAMPDSVNAAVPVAPKAPKIPFIHLKFNNNYNLVMQEITRKWPKSRSKLSGEYLKILVSTADEHREITAFLKEKGEEFHAIDPIEVRPQKVVIKGLPISTDINAIRDDLTERGFNVIKVVQLTRAKSKFKLPIFMVELKKLPGSPDIFQLETCCFLSIKIDSFNRRPGATQCYNCNLFHHSSSNCNIKTRCLKCGEPHKTGDCPIKTKIENPTCINCQQKGHLANSHRCPKFPKPKPKNGEASQNRNGKNVNTNSNIFSASSAIVQKEVSFANIVKNDKQMAPPLDKSEPAQSKPEATPNPPPKENRNNNRNSSKTIESENFGFMDAILELKKFFTDYPSLLELGRQLRNAQGNERVDVFYRHLISLN